MTRISWDDMWMSVARVVAGRSLCDRDRVGAVIVDTRNRIVSSGYNNPAAGFQHNNRGCKAWCQRANATWQWTPGENSEPIAVSQSDDGLVDEATGNLIIDQYLFFTSRGYTRVENLAPGYTDCVSLHAEANALMTADRSAWDGGTVYVTSNICYSCAKLIANSGLRRVVVQPGDVLTLHRNSDASYEHLRACGLTVDVVHQPDTITS